MNTQATFFKLFVTLLFTFICIRSEAQISESAAESNSKKQLPVSPTAGITPNAMAFQRYGDIPVSLSTGIPDISVPIDTLQLGKLDLPMSLSYHCGGVKLNEHSSWVGLGWNLQVGGCITREMHDSPDEYQFVSGEKQPFGYFERHSLLNNDKLWTGDYTTLNEYINFFDGDGSSLIDSEPDKFNFNFDGYSGFFMMDGKGEWQVYCDRSIKVSNITFSTTPQPGEVTLLAKDRIIKTITLTTGDGVDYIFGDDAIDMFINFRNQKKSLWNASAWHLKRIQHPNGDVIDFNYERGNYICTLTNVGFYEVIMPHYDINSGRADPYQGILQSPVYLSRIESSLYSIVFSRSESHELNYSISEDYFPRLKKENTDDVYYLTAPGESNDIEDFINRIRWEKLDSILILNNYADRYKKVTFQYNDKSSERLALEELKIYGMLDKGEECYQFKYKNLGGMPAYLSEQKNHWGYWNNAGGYNGYWGQDRQSRNNDPGDGTLQVE